MSGDKEDIVELRGNSHIVDASKCRVLVSLLKTSGLPSATEYAQAFAVMADAEHMNWMHEMFFITVLLLLLLAPNVVALGYDTIGYSWKKRVYHGRPY